MPLQTIVLNDEPEVQHGLSELASGLSHELKNPLSAIVMGTKLLRRTLTGLSEEQATLVDAVLKESNRLNGILEDFLRFLRPQSLQLTEHDLSFLATEVLDAVQAKMTASQRNPTLRLDRHLEFNCNAFIDREQIQRAFHSYLMHAIETASAGSTLEFHLRQTKTDFYVTVFYDGEESSPYALFRPFEPDRREGSGLALPLCKRIAEAHGGRVGFELANGKCIGLSFWLPLEKSAPGLK